MQNDVMHHLQQNEFDRPWRRWDAMRCDAMMKTREEERRQKPKSEQTCCRRHPVWPPKHAWFLVPDNCKCETEKNANKRGLWTEALPFRVTPFSVVRPFPFFFFFFFKRKGLTLPADWTQVLLLIGYHGLANEGVCRGPFNALFLVPSNHKHKNATRSKSKGNDTKSLVQFGGVAVFRDALRGRRGQNLGPWRKVLVERCVPPLVLQNGPLWATKRHRGHLRRQQRLSQSQRHGLPSKRLYLGTWRSL